MGGAMSMPGSGPSVEDVVALAKGNSVPYAIPLPVNEVCLMSIIYIYVMLRHIDPVLFYPFCIYVYANAITT